MEAEGTRFELSAEETQWLLSSILEDCDWLESSSGDKVLMNLVQQLRALGYGKQGTSSSFQDALMQSFAASMHYGKDSMAAYRDALFKMNRGNIAHHSLVGYLAPWGMGVHSRNQYRQAPKQFSTTLGSADSSAVASPVVIPLAAVVTTQPATQPAASEQTPDFTAGMDKNAGRVENFLASAPSVAMPLDEEEEADKEEEEEFENEEEHEGMAAAAPMMMMRGFSLRSASPMVMAADVEEPVIITWNGSDGNNIWESASEVVEAPWVGSAVFANGNNVVFDDTAASRDVVITGTVAPGLITVNANNASGTSGSGQAVLKYGYAFTAEQPQTVTYALTPDSVSCIADYVDAAGNVTPTSIINNGTALLILNTSNTFSGGITLAEGASLYLGCDHAAGTGAITMNNNTTLMVNYHSSDLSFRTPSVENQLVVTGNVTITPGVASYGESRMPTDWRTLTLSGGISGAGTLNLTGYSFMVKPETEDANSITFNYVSAIAVNERQAPSDYSEADRFVGTVYLKNEICNQPDGTLEYPEVTSHGSKEKHVGGAIQLTLSDDVFSKANLNLTRDINDERTMGDNQGPKGATGPAQTSDNILLLSEASSISVVSLDAEFLGTGVIYNLHNKDMMITAYQNDYKQEYERWHVRIVTDSNTTLKLGNDTDTGTHIYSGSMGFAHSYVQPGQAYIHAPFDEKKGTAVMEPTIAGAGSLGLETLSLEKNGASTQYIHSANLNTLSLQGGTLGFNYLDINGYLNLTSGTTLKLGVTSEVGWTNITASNSDLDTYLTSSVVTIKPGKEMLVMAADDGNKTVNVSGSITMSSGSDIMFNVLRPELGTTAATALMQITGTLTLGADVPINVSFSSVDFARRVNEQEHVYYLVSTGSGISASDFQRRYIPVGHGYYGLLDIKDSKYLVLSVVGDPARTWSGNLTNEPASSGIWTAAPEDDKNVIDYTWKENHKFVHGVVTLFGNLYVPTEWKTGNWDASSMKTSIVSDASHPGITVPVTIDGFTYSGQYQKVEIVGDVAPATIAINADYLQNGVSMKDDTDYYFYGNGCIRDALNTEIQFEDFNPAQQTEAWKTTLIKSGTGTAVIATANTFSGGSVLEGGRVVMQNAAALGTGGVTVQNGVILQGDFADDRSKGTWSDAYTGEGMTTTTVQNPVYVGIYVDADGAISASEVDARITGAHDKKMVLTSLSGGAETVLALYGNSLTPTEKDGKYTYSVFKVLDPGGFYGTIKMDGNLRGAAEGAAGGNVQLEIMTTTKSTGGGDWLNTKVDLSIENGTNRTVLALDALGTASAAASQTAEVDSLNGSGKGGARINSSVLSTSHNKSITLELKGKNAGDYDGVLGFGDFQNTLDYSLAREVAVGAVDHHFGGKGLDGELSVLKLGSATQSVNSAWLNQLNVGRQVNGEITAGGTFVVDEGLVVSSLNIVDGSHAVVGDTSHVGYHALTVSSGGILAFDGKSGDAFAGIGAGIPSRYVSEVVNGTEVVTQLPPEAFVQLQNGATISAYGDWKTNRVRTETINGKSTNIEVGIDIETGATVTFNTHNYTPDEYITANNDVFRNYNASYAIQLLGAMKGTNVDLIFNNKLISAAAQVGGSAVKRADGLGYDGKTGTQMGYVAIRDIHQFTGDITVEGMTALQVQNTNSTANADKADMDILVQGNNAALQFLDGVTDQYINNLVLEDGGQMLLGGTLKETTGGITAVDENQAELKMQNREGMQAWVKNLDMVKTSSSSTISVGGTDTTPMVADNVHISTLASSEGYNKVTLHDTELHNSVVQLHNACSLNLADTVLVDKDSRVKAAAVQNTVATTAELQGPVSPSASESGNEVTTSVDTVVQLTLINTRQTFTTDSGEKVLVLQMDQFLGVDVMGDGLTLQQTAQSANFRDWGYYAGAQYVAIQMGGGSGQFLFEGNDPEVNDPNFSSQLDRKYVLLGADGVQLTGQWVTATSVGSNVSTHLLYFNVPEPTTTTLSLLALTALVARRRRK